jgi:hypothetical protein
MSKYVPTDEDNAARERQWRRYLQAVPKMLADPESARLVPANLQLLSETPFARLVDEYDLTPLRPGVKRKKNPKPVPLPVHKSIGTETDEDEDLF